MDLILLVLFNQGQTASTFGQYPESLIQIAPPKSPFDVLPRSADSRLPRALDELIIDFVVVIQAKFIV